MFYFLIKKQKVRMRRMYAGLHYVMWCKGNCEEYTLYNKCVKGEEEMLYQK